MMNSRILILCWCFAGLLAGFCHAASPATRPFILGADISWVQEDEANGATYFDHGQQRDIFQILKDHGFNYIRLRIFVNPGAADGYAANNKEAFCDLKHTAAMAKRVRAAGLGFLLDFHYSDTWADPGKQAKPAAWAKLDFPGLKQAVFDHTHSVLSALKAQGTTPDMVQIGNEITNGMLWPDGQAKDHFDNLAELLKSGIAATHQVDPSIRIVLHHANGNNPKPVEAWMDNLLSRDVKFDIIGLSCNSNVDPDHWKKTFDELAAKYPKYDLMACEYSYHKRGLNDAIHDLPDHRGLGSFIWEPTRHHEAIFDPAGGDAASTVTTQGGHHPRTGRFDTNDLIDLYPKMAKDYGNQ
jgi:beta-galactosidase/arabinogalactan endo-1,4-beta-galactosidase